MSDEQLANLQYRRYLRRRNDRDILQRGHQPELGRLRIEQRYRIEQRVGVERRCRQQHIVHPGLPGVSAGQPIVQLTKTKSICGAAISGARTPTKPSARPVEDFL